MTISSTLSAFPLLYILLDRSTIFASFKDIPSEIFATMLSLITSMVTGLAFASATSANPAPARRVENRAAESHGGCVALASSWTLTNFGTSSSPGKSSVNFNFTDSLNRRNYCYGGPDKFHDCDNPDLRFKWANPSITLEETVLCSG